MAFCGLASAYTVSGSVSDNHGQSRHCVALNLCR